MMRHPILLMLPLTTALVIGAWTITVAEITRSQPDGLLFIVGDNLFLAAGVLSVMLVIAVKPRQWQADAPMPQPARTSRLSIGMVMLITVVFVMVVALRALHQPPTLLNWVTAALMIGFAPGYSLAAALLPHSSSALERALYAVPLSVCAQLSLMLWLIALGVPVNTPLVFAVAGALIVVGLGAAALRR